VEMQGRGRREKRALYYYGSGNDGREEDEKGFAGSMSRSQHELKFKLAFYTQKGDLLKNCYGQ